MNPRSPQPLRLAKEVLPWTWSRAGSVIGWGGCTIPTRGLSPAPFAMEKIMGNARELMEDMGFVEVTGWDHEVWMYDWQFWVHFGRDRSVTLDCPQNNIDVEEFSRKEFFQKFITSVTTTAWESGRQCPY